MNTRAAVYVHAIRGPVLLIVIGILFAVQQWDILPFYKTWPLILIMIGVMKLIERAVSPGQPAAQVPPAGPFGGGPAAGGPVR